MHVALLLAACLAVAPAASDWVEISQQRYTKPVRGHAHPEEAGPTNYPREEESRLAYKYPNQDGRRAPNHSSQGPERLTPNYPVQDDNLRLVHDVPKGDKGIYPNHSISEPAWNQNTYQVPGNVKRFHADNFKAKANVTPQFSLEIYEPGIEDTPELYKLKEQETVSATIERIPNKGSVQRVQLANTPVRSSFFTNSVNPIKRNDVIKYESTSTDGDLSEELEKESDLFRNAQKEVVTVSPINGVKHILIGTIENPVKNYDKVKAISFRKYLQTQYSRKPYTQMEYESDRIKNHNLNVSVVEENRVVDVNIKTKDIQSKPSQPNDVIQEKIPNNVKKAQNNKAEIQDTEFEEVTISSDIKNKANKQNIRNEASNHFSKGKATTPTSDTNSNEDKKKVNEDENTAKEEIKVNTMKNMMKFMKLVADTISKNTKGSVNGKVTYLNELKDTLLNSIKERIDATWPDDASSRARRRSRAATARGHVEFPSSESSLMTISFLTFAVFLIKLVLQVIQTYKNKAMMVAPLVVASAGRAVRKLPTLH